MEPSLINGRYRTSTELGKGGYGMVLKVHDEHKNTWLAIKKDISTKGSVLQEAQILRDLQGGEGIPRLYDTGKTRTYTYMILQLLGENLSSILKTVKRFSINTITAVLLQSLARVEYVHSKGYVHRDIKPQQFLIGPRDVIYLVDYGISKKYIIDNYHISFQTQCPRVGSSAFASINAHIGARLSRRDDLESLMYTAIVLCTGTLPWYHCKYEDDNRKWYEAFQAKRDISLNTLFEGCPVQFLSMFKYIRTIKFEERPNYEYLREQVHAIRNEYSFSFRKFEFYFSKTKHNTVIIKKTAEDQKKSEETSKVDDQKKEIKSMKKKKSFTISEKQGTGNNENFLRIPCVRGANSTHASSKSIAVLDDTAKNCYPEFVNKKSILLAMKAFQGHCREEL